MSFDENIYYHPEQYGLTLFGEVEWSDGCYQFDTTAVWKRDLDGAFFMAEDSGCSCPSPFENHTAASLAGPLTGAEVIGLLNSRLDEAKEEDEDEDEYWYGGDLNSIADSIVRLTQRIVG